MNGKVTRIGLDEDSKGSSTDWARLRSLTEEEIELAIAADDDAYRLDEFLGRTGASYRYVIYLDRSERWRWRLLAAGGEVIAVSGQAFPSRDAVQAAIETLRDALLGARSKAA